MKKLTFVLALVVGCGGAADASLTPDYEAPPAPAPESASARDTATKFLDSLVANDSQKTDTLCDGDIGWKVIPDKMGKLESYELADKEETFDGDVLLTAATKFADSDVVVFALIFAKKNDRWLMVNFRMLEVVRTTVRGSVIERSRTALKVRAAGGWLPPVGAEGDLTVSINAAIPLFGGGNLVVARARVIAAADDMVQLEVLEEKSRMTIDGHQVDHLKRGGDVTFLWGFTICKRKTESGGAPYECVDA